MSYVGGSKEKEGELSCPREVSWCDAFCGEIVVQVYWSEADADFAYMQIFYSKLGWKTQLFLIQQCELICRFFIQCCGERLSFFDSTMWACMQIFPNMSGFVTWCHHQTVVKMVMLKKGKCWYLPWIFYLDLFHGRKGHFLLVYYAACNKPSS